MVSLQGDKNAGLSLSGGRGTLAFLEHLLCAISFLEFSSLIFTMTPADGFYHLHFIECSFKEVEALVPSKPLRVWTGTRSDRKGYAVPTCFPPCSPGSIKGLVPVVLPCRGLQGAPLSGSPRGSLQPWDNWENSRFLKGSSEGLVHLSSG